MLLVLPQVLAPGLKAQAFKVALRVTEDASGQFGSEFAAALRRLTDVQVVTTDEKPDFVYSIVVLCLPDDCRKANGYAVAISLDRPLTFSKVSSILHTGLWFGRVLSPPERALAWPHEQATDSAATVMLGLLKRYQERVAYSVANWGRDVFRSAIWEDVAQFDRKCLEKLRMERRMIQSYAARDTVTGAALSKRVFDASAGWIC
jgi:hypothetical protein